MVRAALMSPRWISASARIMSRSAPADSMGGDLKAVRLPLSSTTVVVDFPPTTAPGWFLDLPSFGVKPIEALFEGSCAVLGSVDCDACAAGAWAMRASIVCCEACLVSSSRALRAWISSRAALRVIREDGGTPNPNCKCGSGTSREDRRRSPLHVAPRN